MKIAVASDEKTHLTDFVIEDLKKDMDQLAIDEEFESEPEKSS